MERLPRQTYPCFHCKRECAVEFSGTFLLGLFGAGAVSLTVLAPVSFSLFIVAAAFGATVAVLILVAGRTSGAHVNPAVTIAQFV